MISKQKKFTLLLISVLIIPPLSIAGIFSSKQGKTFKTRGTAVIYKSGTLTAGIEKRGIQIPPVFNVESHSMFIGLTHDSESGWTQCRIPLKTELSLIGPVERSLVFDCYPLTYYPQ